MKKSLLFMAFLFILGGLCVNAAETTLNFTGWNFEGAEPAWGNSYSSHTATFDEATVTFSKAAKQTGTVKDCPVMKTGTITVVFNDVTVSHVKFNLKQWGTKTKTAKLATSVDGTNFSDTGISSSTFVLESDLSSDIKAVQVSFTEANNQVGLSQLCSLTTILSLLHPPSLLPMSLTSPMSSFGKAKLPRLTLAINIPPTLFLYLKTNQSLLFLTKA